VPAVGASEDERVAQAHFVSDSGVSGNYFRIDASCLPGLAKETLFQGPAACYKLHHTITLRWRIKLNIPIAIAILSTGVAALSAAFTYWRNANTKRAEFLLLLHKAFFVDTTYKPLRDLLDNPSESDVDKLRSHIQEETAELTDFLNFFELIAYFESCRTLRAADVDALLNYYLHLIKVNGPLLTYIGKDQTSFEYLKTLIKRVK